jgi:hypothetical protein
MESVQLETRSCSRCSAPVGEQARFCERCGTAVGPTAKQICAACREPLSPAARFCSRCGTQARRGQALPAVRGADRWDQVQRRLAAIDWARVNRIALPIAALLLAGLVGFIFGQQDGRSPAPANRTVSDTRGWRGTSPSAGLPLSDEAPVPGIADRRDAGTTVDSQSGQALERASPLTRFRDFHITASSWELSHPPELAVDGDPYTFWHAWKTERFSNGEWLTFTFPTERVITRIGLLPGRMGAGARAEGRIRSLLVKAPGGSPQKLIFADRPELQYRYLKEPVRARKLVLRIATVLPGRETRHILIPEVQIWGHQVPSRLTRRTGE